MTGRLKTLAGAAVALALTASPGLAMETDTVGNCLKHEQLTVYLDRAFSEARVAEALFENGNRMELFASRRGSWTLLERLPDGESCIQAHGTRMRVERKNVAKPPAS